MRKYPKMTLFLLSIVVFLITYIEEGLKGMFSHNEDESKLYAIDLIKMVFSQYFA